MRMIIFGICAPTYKIPHEFRFHNDFGPHYFPSTNLNEKFSEDSLKESKPNAKVLFIQYDHSTVLYNFMHKNMWIHDLGVFYIRDQGMWEESNLGLFVVMVLGSEHDEKRFTSLFSSFGHGT